MMRLHFSLPTVLVNSLFRSLISLFVLLLLLVSVFRGPSLLLVHVAGITTLTAVDVFILSCTFIESLQESAHLSQYVRLLLINLSRHTTRPAISVIE